MYDSKVDAFCQDESFSLKTVLDDTSSTGVNRKWRERKLANEYLSIAYEDVNTSKAERLKRCGHCLTFAVDSDGNKQLVNAESCHVRLCPLCSWRRSLKAFYNALKIVNYLNDNLGNIAYIFVTLTVRNCPGDKLVKTIDDMFDAVRRLFQLKAVRKAWKGSIRNLEVTHNVNRDSKDFDTYHPHIHCLIAVNKSYFTSRDYISQAKLTQLWKESLRVDYNPVVNMKRCYGSDAHAVAECSKYSTKSKEILNFEDWDLTVDTVRVFDTALANRRLINYSGIMREVKYKLQLENADDDNCDLVHVGADEPLDKNYHLEYYWWYSGYRQYYKVDI